MLAAQDGFVHVLHNANSRLGTFFDILAKEYKDPLVFLRVVAYVVAISRVLVSDVQCPLYHAILAASMTKA